LEREIWGSIQFIECDKNKVGGREGGRAKNISQKLSMNSSNSQTNLERKN